MHRDSRRAVHSCYLSLLQKTYYNKNRPPSCCGSRLWDLYPIRLSHIYLKSTSWMESISLSTNVTLANEIHGQEPMTPNERQCSRHSHLLCRSSSGWLWLASISNLPFSTRFTFLTPLKEPAKSPERSRNHLIRWHL